VGDIAPDRARFGSVNMIKLMHFALALALLASSQAYAFNPAAAAQGYSDWQHEQAQNDLARAQTDLLRAWTQCLQAAGAERCGPPPAVSEAPAQYPAPRFYDTAPHGLDAACLNDCLGRYSAGLCRSKCSY